MNEGRVGRVWLVGAGPGDAGLLTLRGREVLQDAEAVVYDRLVGDGVLAMIPSGAERVDVGKSGGSHPVPQREIEALLVRLALSGRRVVRLKGGDPFLFGRGGEEAEALRQHGVPFEVVPGVTSAVAAPAWAGIPVTHRGLASSLHVVTAHSREGGLPDLDFEALARLAGTLVFLMGVEGAPELCARLMGAGMAPETPAAAVERGTSARQRRVSATLRTLAEAMRDAGVCPPAVLVVGAVAALGERFDWRAALPLSGVRAAVTRPRERAGRLSRMLRDAGAEVLEVPCIATEPLEEPLSRIGGADWAVFTSAAGIEALTVRLAREGRDVRELGGTRLAAIGPATTEALRACGLRVDLMPDIYDGEHLAIALAGRVKAGEKVLLLRAEEHGPELTEGLRAAGVSLREVPLYRTCRLRPELPEDLDMAFFTSASTVRAFAACAPAGWRGWTGVAALCIGRQTARAAREAGFARVFTAGSATLEALLAAAVAARSQIAAAR